VRNYALLTLLALFLYGCQNGGKSDTVEKTTHKASLQKTADTLTLTIAGETITSKEIVMDVTEQLRSIPQTSDYELFKRQVEPRLKETITIRILNALLYQQAKKNTREDVDKFLEKPAEAEIRKFIMELDGDYAKAEDILKQRGMDWAGFKEYQKKLILTEYYLSTLLPKTAPITYSEMMDCYNRMKDDSFVIPATIKFQSIDIEPIKLQTKEPNYSQVEQARKLADEIIQQIKAGKDFLELANEYPGVLFAAYSKPIPPEDLKYKILAEAAEQLEPGGISGPLETAGQEHIFIMKLEEKLPKSYQPLEKVQKEVKAKISSERLKQAQEKVLGGLRRQAESELNNEFTEFCLQEIHRMVNKTQTK
jgi:hypothetical protein